MNFIMRKSNGDYNWFISITVDYDKFTEIIKWCNETYGEDLLNKIWIYSAGNKPDVRWFWFLTEEDAIMFKLVWS